MRTCWGGLAFLDPSDCCSAEPFDASASANLGDFLLGASLLALRLWPVPDISFDASVGGKIVVGGMEWNDKNRICYRPECEYAPKSSRPFLDNASRSWVKRGL